MDDETNDANSTNNVSQRSERSPTFSKEEVKTLIDLIEKFKGVILNKSTNSNSNHAKEIAWAKIAKEFNSHGFKNTRSSERLRTKWENLKKEARKLSNNVMDVEYNQYNQLISQVLTMMNDTDNSAIIDSVSETEMEMNDEVKTIKKDKDWDDDDDKMSEQSNDGDNECRRSRSLNFSPQECSLLLKCVKSEKQHLFTKANTVKAIRQKNHAWSRIEYSFNKLSPQKRTSKALRDKFKNMKKLVKNFNIKDLLPNDHIKLIEDVHVKKYKSEPMSENTAEESFFENSDNEHDDDQLTSVLDKKDISPDPLTTVLNGDSGIDSMHNFGYNFGDQGQDKEIAKMKLDLLKYQLDTAKIKRGRIQEKLEYDRKERQSKETEMSLRLRAARLEVVAAESKLPSSHPALEYSYNEIKAQEYMQQFNNT